MQDFLRQARATIKNNAHPEEVQGDILERLLSLLSTLPATNNKNSSNNNSSGYYYGNESILPSLRHILFTVSDDDNNNNSNNPSSHISCLSPEWIAGLTFLNNNKESSILNVMSGLELHAVVQTFWHQVFLDDCHDMNHHSMTLLLLLLLLCAHALDKCNTCSALKNRHKRWRSVLWQSLRFMQQTCAVLENNAVNDDDDDDDNDGTSRIDRLRMSRSFVVLLLDLWQIDFLPAISQVGKSLLLIPQQQRQQDVLSKNDHATLLSFSIALSAAVIRTTCLLMDGCLFASTDTDPTLHIQQLYHQLQDFVTSSQLKCHGDDDDDLKHTHWLLPILALYPWQRRQYESKTSRSLELLQSCDREESLWMYYTCGGGDDEYNDYRDEIDTEDEPVEKEKGGNNDSIHHDMQKRNVKLTREDREWVETGWKDQTTSIALLVATTFDDGSNCQRPLVWSTDFQWKVYFPHVAPLLLLSNKQLYHEKNWPSVGFSMLEKLLACTPPRSLAIFDRSDDPLSPIGTIQLICNNMVLAATSSELTTYTAGQVYEVLQQLLEKYRDRTVVYLKWIPDLIQNSPNAGLVPKLIDLWRRPLLEHASQQQPQEQHDTEQFMPQLWSHLDEHYLRQLEQDHLVDINNVVQLKQVEQLISSCEVYVAVVALLQLWIKLTQQSPFENLQERLHRIHQAVGFTVQRQEQRIQQSHHANDFFRLYLLEDKLGQTLDLLQ